MKNPATWFEIYVYDLQRAQTFYETVFNLKLTPLPSPLPHLSMLTFAGDQNSYGVNGALVRMEGFKPVGNSTLIYFYCQDCAVEESRVVAAGGKIEHSKMPIGEYGFIAHVVDTECNMIGLHSPSAAHA